MQIKGDGYRVPLNQLRSMFLRSQELRTRILQFTQQQSLTSHQMLACGLNHTVEARLALWLLMVQDRVQSSVLQLSQEVLAEKLNVERRTLNVKINKLKRAGLIETRGLNVEIVKRTELEHAACECYLVTKRCLMHSTD